MGFALAWCSTHALLRWVGALLPVGMLVAIVVTGNHYVVDGLAGAAIGALGLLLAFGLERLRIGHGVRHPPLEPSTRTQRHSSLNRSGDVPCACFVWAAPITMPD